jgi:hypothetical protein
LIYPTYYQYSEPEQTIRLSICDGSEKTVDHIPATELRTIDGVIK